MKKYNQKGFTALETILLMLVVVLVAGASWLVVERSNDTVETLKTTDVPFASTTNSPNSTTFKVPDQKPIELDEGESSNWYRYKTSEFSVAIPDGWEMIFSPDSNGDDLFAFSEQTYTSGKKAIVRPYAANDPVDGVGGIAYTISHTNNTAITDCKEINDANTSSKNISGGGYITIRTTTTNAGIGANNNDTSLSYCGKFEQEVVRITMTGDNTKVQASENILLEMMRSVTL
jgi:uncharacterized protein (UPF0333 family)